MIPRSERQLIFAMSLSFALLAFVSVCFSDHKLHELVSLHLDRIMKRRPAPPALELDSSSAI